MLLGLLRGRGMSEEKETKKEEKEQLLPFNDDLY